jgi:uncharacterized membrane protein
MGFYLFIAAFLTFTFHVLSIISLDGPGQSLFLLLGINLIIFYRIAKKHKDYVFIWKPASKLIRKKVLAFKKYIKEQTNVKDTDASTLKEVDDYIIYGLALGEADKLLKSIVGEVSYI